MATRLTILLLAMTLIAATSTSDARAQEPGFTGNVPAAGIGLVGWSGGPVDEMAAAAEVHGCALTSVWVTTGGDVVGFVVGAPPFVNEQWMTRVGVDVAPGTIVIVVCTPAHAAAGFQIDFIDVGQGDATLITVNGQRLLVDGGRSQARIEERLVALGVSEVHAILSTHPDADHIAGLIRVLDLYDVEHIYLNGGGSTSQTYATYMARVEAEGAEVAILERGDAIPLGGLRLEVLHPAGLTGDSNADSLVVQLSCGSVDVLLTGDATLASEQSMLDAGVLGPVTVLKVGHHGSSTSTGQPFLDVVQPQYAVISAGMNSQFGHPHPEVVARLVAMDVELYHTDTTPADDTVTMTSDCSTVEFHAEPMVP